VVEYSPIPAVAEPEVSSNGLTLTDISVVPKWRVFSGYDDILPGTSRKHDEQLVWSVSPGEWTVVGPKPDADTVDLTHVRVPKLLAKVCAIDLGDEMFPNGAAGRTLVAGVATELVRDDKNGNRSYLILPSRSFGRYLHGVLVDAGAELGLKQQ
jgi:sarcosine oxidase gamma subunit